MDITLHTTNLMQFRSSLYQSFHNRADTLMELMDAMCSMADARSVVEYSLASSFRRSYSTIFKAIDEMKLGEMWLATQVGISMCRLQIHQAHGSGNKVTRRLSNGGTCGILGLQTPHDSDPTLATYG